MTKGKPWTRDQEKCLRGLIEAKDSLDVIAVKLRKSPEAVRKKIERLGLEVVDPKTHRTTTSLQIPDDLPSVEEVLKELAGALEAARMAGLEKVDVQRLQVIATLARTYKEMLVDYVGYRMIERKLVDLEAKYAKLVGEKTKNSQAEAAASSVA